jgi:polysaccharide pyruvyl transferase WcaK-like protein
LLGDVGSPDGYHVGDEAMLEVAVQQLRSRGVEGLTVVAGDLASVAERYGVSTVPRFGFGPIVESRDRCDERLERIAAAAAGRSSTLDATDPAWSIIEAIAESDVAIITGGGNLASAFPAHIYERAAFAAVAEFKGVPLVLSGQGLGPMLNGRDLQLVAGILSRAAMVRLRDDESCRLAIELGASPTTTRVGLDDAVSLTLSDLPLARLGLVPGEFVAMSFPDYTGDETPNSFVNDLRVLIADVQTLTNLEVVLLPHEGPLGSDPTPNRDSEMLERLVGPGVHLLPTMLARETATVTAAAALSFSARYHPIVFASAAGVPTIGIWLDQYTRQKVEGGLANVGCGALALPAASIGTGLALEVIAEVWKRREEVSSHLRHIVDARTRGVSRWWDDVVRVSNDAPSPSAGPVELSVEEFALSPRLDQRRTALTRTIDVLMAKAGSAVSAREEADVAAHAARAAAGAAIAANEELRHSLTKSADFTHPLVDVDMALELEATRQVLWERERYSAAVAREADALAREAESLRGRLAQADARAEAILRSSSWRVTLPLRAIVHPAKYLRAARHR